MVVMLMGGCAGIVKKPSREEARGFAVETYWHTDTLALHKTWQWLGDQDICGLMRSYNKTVLDSRQPKQQT